MMKYVIIGNSAAGIGAVEGIRQIDKQGEITILTNESHHTYSRPLISYLLLGKTTEEKMKYRGDSFYSDNNCKLMTNVTVTGIDSKAKQVSLADGSKVPYDKLLVATGSSPFVPPFEGLDSVKNKVTFMSLDDARKLNEMIGKNPDKKVLIVGAGLIGLKCAEGIVKRVSHITVVDLAPRILSSILDEDGAKIVQRHIEGSSANTGGAEVDFKLASSVKKFDGNTAYLEDGKTINFDILVLAVGVRPNTSLLKDVADIDRGIIVNEKSETSVPDIYAAGDCTQTLDISSGQNKIMALLPNAYMQGECAGINMAGSEKSFDKAIPMNAIGFFGLHMITAGNYVGTAYIEVKEKGALPEDTIFENNKPQSLVPSPQSPTLIKFKKLFYGEHKLNGYIMIGNVEKAGIYTSLIREQTPLDSIDFDLVCQKPGLMAFTKEVRATKLGGARL